MMLVLAVIAILALIAIPNMLASKTAANEANTCGCLKSFLTSEFQFYKKFDYFAPSANRLFQANLISPDAAHAFVNHNDNGDVGDSPKCGYFYWVLAGDINGPTDWYTPGSSGPTAQMVTWAATSHASIPFATGNHQYFVSEQGSIFRHDEPQSGTPGYGLFLLDSMPTLPPPTWSPAR